MSNSNTINAFAFFGLKPKNVASNNPQKCPYTKRDEHETTVIDEQQRRKIEEEEKKKIERQKQREDEMNRIRELKNAQIANEEKIQEEALIKKEIEKNERKQAYEEEQKKIEQKRQISIDKQEREQQRQNEEKRKRENEMKKKLDEEKMRKQEEEERKRKEEEQRRQEEERRRKEEEQRRQEEERKRQIEEEKKREERKKILQEEFKDYNSIIKPNLYYAPDHVIEETKKIESKIRDLESVRANKITIEIDYDDSSFQNQDNFDKNIYQKQLEIKIPEPSKVLPIIPSPSQFEIICNDNIKEPCISTKESLRKYIQSEEDIQILEKTNNKARDLFIKKKDLNSYSPTKEEVLSYFQRRRISMHI